MYLTQEADDRMEMYEAMRDEEMFPEREMSDAELNAMYHWYRGTHGDLTPAA